jgi:hypothetical protein
LLLRFLPCRPSSPRREHAFQACNPGELLRTRAKHCLKAPRQLAFANVELGGEAPDTQVRIPLQQRRGPARNPFNAAGAQIRSKESFHAGKSRGARPRLREHLLEQGNLAGAKEGLKTDSGVEETLHALSQKAGCRLRPEACADQPHCSARPRYDDAGLA